MNAASFLPASRSHALERLENFAPKAGSSYTRLRNFDLGPPHPHVSALSPYIRHRLIAEQEVAHEALRLHGERGAEKFIAEVFWRTYFKGWLENRPHVWSLYKDEVAGLVDGLSTASYAKDYRAAVEGRTGIDCFDAWAEELVTTGYLHNHARMWFASIWIFTLRLPWALGADFFLRHLLDGDAAANTLSWRWVAGLHTRGKNYAARASNIRKFTDGRFNPEGQLAVDPEPLEDDWNGAPATSPDHGPFIPPEEPVLLLLHEDDYGFESLPLDRVELAAVCTVLAPERRSPLPVAGLVKDFTTAAAQDTVERAKAAFGCPSVIAADCPVVRSMAERVGVRTILVPYAPTGPMQDKLGQAKLEGFRIIYLQRSEDRAAWPACTDGFFKLKKTIPKLLSAGDLLV
ncbi:MAG: FAD-binding domain-containing protein [Pseudomonadota bacterium]